MNHYHLRAVKQKSETSSVVEHKLAEGRQCLEDRTNKLRKDIAEQPIKAAAIAFAGGYVARALPLMGITLFATRAALYAAPRAAFALGCYHAYNLLKSDKRPQAVGARKSSSHRAKNVSSGVASSTSQSSKQAS